MLVRKVVATALAAGALMAGTVGCSSDGSDAPSASSGVEGTTTTSGPQPDASSVPSGPIGDPLDVGDFTYSVVDPALVEVDGDLVIEFTVTSRNDGDATATSAAVAFWCDDPATADFSTVYLPVLNGDQELEDLDAEDADILQDVAFGTEAELGAGESVDARLMNWVASTDEASPASCASAGIAFGQATTDADDLLAYDLVGYVEMDDALLGDLNARLPEYS